MSERVVVVGAGTMGAGIAFLAARGGYEVVLVDPDAAAIERARTRVRAGAERAGDPSIAARVRSAPTIPSDGSALLAIEAVPERIELKSVVMRAMAAAVRPDGLLATNTSALSVGALATDLPDPSRVLGLHFFNPPEAMKLVEIVHAPSTADAAIEAAYAFVERIGKSAALAADTPGFIVNRVARPYYLQALRALEHDVATVPELDALARSVGFRMGPFELMDFIGLDVNLATSESVYARTDAARLIPSALQRRLVEGGRLGRKSAKGFYDYSNGVPEPLDLRVAAPEATEPLRERVAIVGCGGVADELHELLAPRYAHVARIENEELLDELALDTTIVIDVGDGTTDRVATIAQLDSLLGPETVILADAYASDVSAAAARMRHPERLIGYGVLSSLERQSAIEVVDAESASDDALVLAQELFETLGKGVVLVEDVPGLFLGRVVGSIVNEAVVAVHEGVASAEDVDLAMRLGTNYPIGPIAWGREIGGARIARILQRVAAHDGAAFAPHRSLWVLDVEEEGEAEPLDPFAMRAASPVDEA